jgi:hypothetical protein
VLGVEPRPQSPIYDIIKPYLYYSNTNLKN